MEGIKNIKEVFHFIFPSFPVIEKKYGNCQQTKRLDIGMHRYYQQKNPYEKSRFSLPQAVRQTDKDRKHYAKKTIIHNKPACKQVCKKKHSEK